MGSNNESSSSGVATTSSSLPLPPKKRKTSTDDSPISNSTSDLIDKLATFSGEVRKTVLSKSNEAKLDKLIRLLHTADFATETLQRICMIEEVKKGVEEEAPVDLESFYQLEMKSSPKKQMSESANRIAALNVSIGIFLGVVITEVILCTKAETKSMCRGKRSRLERLLEYTEDYLQALKPDSEKIQAAMRKIDQNYAPKRFCSNLVLSGEELETVQMMREKPQSKKQFKEIRDYYNKK
ncbi:uncharacterized protein LOC129574637 isoform X2 [Sitodiplosis mosellana]|uniref:uncharacterized protein LOC129574637 isoform X2 n=1 Tax=Sitodiplosis mosellana TaxID=263140 RepID=UPI0024447C4C|nr:uncharacterized protein LOC129574637 isoform X2 [Sitodiplosis mosellana]